MFVAIVTAPGAPASAIVSPSRSACSGLALSTVCLIPLRFRLSESSSETSTEIVPTSTGWPARVPLFDLLEPRRPTCRPWSCRPGRCGRSRTIGRVGRDLDHRQLVDLHELGRLGQRRTGHPRELVVHPEVVLQRDRRERLVLLLDAHALLRLDRLVQTLGPAPSLEDPAGELVDDLDLAVDHRVVDVALEQRLGLQRLDAGG